MIVLIGGPSGAGKSEIAKELAKKLDASYVPMDHFYNTKEEMDAASLDNWDHPDAFNWGRFKDFLRQLDSRYETLTIPDYVKEPGYVKDEPLKIERKDTVIIDGMYALTDSVEISNGQVLKLYVDADVLKRRERKVFRDSKIGRTEEQVKHYFDKQTSVMEVAHVFPTKKAADYVIENNGHGISGAVGEAYNLIQAESTSN